ncbi:hypothetical protein [Tissierella creatinophila]|uniref:Uncharacterized protein n=1 Tax=Tissierella creatinophila DSM 6911 TaxID=1123403 RepID=A0A1U7M5I2_TISCR|nr:hypothetical protein [Tissierella creatinophila]OLS02573.1 hypothetical protein TICRE_13740 [Tissierella creatinophila DSM 6911]
MKKKDMFKASYNKKIYEFVGKWGCDIILSPVEAEDDQCLIYTANEIKEFLETGELERIIK